MNTLPRAARWYVQTLIVLGTSGLLTMAVLAGVPWSPSLAAAVLAAALLAAQKLVLVGKPGEKGSRTNQMSTLSLGFPVVFASLLWFDPASSMLVGVASGISACLYPRRHPLYRLWFMSVTLGLTALGSGAVMRALGLVPGLPLSASPEALILGTLTYYLLNTGTVCLAVSLSQRSSLWATFQSGYLFSLPSYLIGGAVVAGMFWIQQRWGAAVALLSLGCLVLVHFSYRSYLERLQQLQISEGRMQEVCMATVESLALATEAKDGVTHSHIRRVQHVSLALGKQLGVSEAELQALRVAAVTHDMGKLGIPDQILRKEGPLTPEEFEVMKTHVQIGVKILEPVQFPWPVLDVVRTHHERWDGRGYPGGLKGEEIPVGGRIVSLADVFDALTSDRPYRAALGYEQALELIRRHSGSQFDPRVVEAFEAIFPTVRAVLVAEEQEQAVGQENRAAVESLLPLEREEVTCRVWEKIGKGSLDEQAVGFTDPVTGVLNARYLAGALPGELQAAQRAGRAFSVLLMQVVGYDRIRESYGVERSERVLQMVANVAGSALREETTVCRYGEEEFLVLLPNATSEEAERVGERIRERIRECLVPGTRLPVGIRLGIGSFPEAGMTVNELLNVADESLYAEELHGAGLPLRQIA